MDKQVGCLLLSSSKHQDERSEELNTEFTVDLVETSGGRSPSKLYAKTERSEEVCPIIEQFLIKAEEQKKCTFAADKPTVKAIEYIVADDKKKIEPEVLVQQLKQQQPSQEILFGKNDYHNNKHMWQSKAQLYQPKQLTYDSSDIKTICASEA